MEDTCDLFRKIPIQNDDMHGVNKLVNWQVVWLYALGMEPRLVLTLRIGMLASQLGSSKKCGWEE